MSGLKRSQLNTPRHGRPYPLNQEPQRYPPVPWTFRVDRGGALRPVQATKPVVNHPWDKSSYAWPRNPRGIEAFETQPVDNSFVSDSHHWYPWSFQ